MRIRKGGMLIAMALVLLACAIDAWDWVLSHDQEILTLFRRTPVVGASVDDAAGANTRWARLTIAVDASYPPFASADTQGNLVGFEVDLARALGARAADQPVVVNMDTGDSAFDALAAREIDAIIAGFTYLPDMTVDLAFSDPYFEAGPLLLARPEHPEITDPRSLAGKRVAVEAGTQGEEEAGKLQKQLRNLQVMPRDDAEQVLSMVAEGRADAAILDRSSIPTETPAMEGFRVVGGPIASVPYRVVLRRQDRGLLLTINRALGSMKTEGLLGEMEQRWFR